MLAASAATVPPGVDSKAAYEELRRRVFDGDGPLPGSAEASVPYLRSEHMLVRFLIARQWDVDKAADMLRKHYRWLAETKMQMLLQDPFPEEPTIKAYYPQTYHGTDKMGRPIYIERPGRIDMPRLLQTLTPERLLQYVYAGTEQQIRLRLPACTLVRGEVVDKSLNIMDLTDLGFSLVTHAVARRVLRDVVTMLQDHYPECSGKVVIVNAPRVFSIAWSFVKPMLDEKTVQKISIYGADREGRRALLELVDADQLPSFLGGTCICDGSDPESCMRCAKGPWVNKEVAEMLNAVPLEQIMTPEGARLLHQRRTQCQTARATAEAATSIEEATSSETAAASEAAAPEAKQDHQVPQVALSTPLEASPSKAPTPEIAEADLEVSLLEEEVNELAERHMSTLSQWVKESNELVREIGRDVIEYAQGYYDSQLFLQGATWEQTAKQDALDGIISELEKARMNLSMAEAALENFLAGKADLSDEHWARLAPILADEEIANVVAADPKLSRMLRVSTLSDYVTDLQRQRETATAALGAKSQEVEGARKRMEVEEMRHRWSYSVRRAAPYFERRVEQESTINAQLSQVQAAERRLLRAREYLATLRGNHAAQEALLAQEASLTSFEIAGAEPQEDEYHSCPSEPSSDREEFVEGDGQEQEP